MKRLILLPFFCASLQAATWFAAVNGTDTNGSYANPWGVKYSATNTFLQPGDTVILKNGGPFVCTETNVLENSAPLINFGRSGTPSAKITYKSETLWGFSFDGGLFLDTGISNVVLTGLRIYWSGSTNRVHTNTLTGPPGVTDFGLGNEVLHNLIENTGHPGIGSWKTTRGKKIQGNVIRFSGFNDFVNVSGSSAGSGMYLQNQNNSSEALVQGNISYFNYTTGMKAYGGTDIWGFRFANNISVANHEAGMFHSQNNAGSAGITIQSNYIWNGGGLGLRLGYVVGVGGHSNAVVEGNYIVETNAPIDIEDGWINDTFSNNIVVNPFKHEVVELEHVGETNGNVASHHFGSNTYWAGSNAANGTNSFYIYDVVKTFPQWQGTILGDSNSTLTAASPTTLTSYVFRPSTDTDFAHIAVFNWPSNSTTTVDLSAFFGANQSLDIYDAQEIPVSYTNIVYDGSSPVTLDLSRTNISTMLGTFGDIAPQVWSGFDQRFRAFVIHRVPGRHKPVKGF